MALEEMEFGDSGDTLPEANVPPPQDEPEIPATQPHEVAPELTLLFTFHDV